jgi:hypothetical protein
VAGREEGLGGEEARADLRPQDAPRDLMARGAGDVPPELAAGLAQIGVL